MGLTLRTGLAASLPVLGILWLLDAPEWFGRVVITEQFLAVMVGLSTLAGLVLAPLPGRWQALDWAAGLAALASWCWLAWNYEHWLIDVMSRGPEKWVPAAVAVAAVLEATRRQCGLVLALLAAAFLAYGFIGWMAPVSFEAA